MAQGLPDHATTESAVPLPARWQQSPVADGMSLPLSAGCGPGAHGCPTQGQANPQVQWGESAGADGAGSAGRAALPAEHGCAPTLGWPRSAVPPRELHTSWGSRGSSARLWGMRPDVLGGPHPHPCSPQLCQCPWPPHSWGPLPPHRLAALKLAAGPCPPLQYLPPKPCNTCPR